MHFYLSRFYAYESMVWSMLYISDHLLAKVLMASCTITATGIMAIDIEDPGSLFLINNISC